MHWWEFAGEKRQAKINLQNAKQNNDNVLVIVKFTIKLCSFVNGRTEREHMFDNSIDILR